MYALDHGKHGSKSYRAAAAAGLGAAGDGRAALGTGVVHGCLCFEILLEEDFFLEIGVIFLTMARFVLVAC